MVGKQAVKAAWDLTKSSDLKAIPFRIHDRNKRLPFSSPVVWSPVGPVYEEIV